MAENNEEPEPIVDDQDIALNIVKDEIKSRQQEALKQLTATNLGECYVKMVTDLNQTLKNVKWTKYKINFQNYTQMMLRNIFP